MGIIAVSALTWGIYHYVSAENKVKAEIYYYSKLVETVDLNSGEDKTFSIPQDQNVVIHLYKDGAIAFVKSDCPDKVCIHAGKLRASGQFAACLPNGIIIKIVPVDGNGNDDADLVI